MSGLSICIFVQALDTLGRTKWRINKRILDVVEILWSQGGGIAGLVNRKDVSGLSQCLS